MRDKLIDTDDPKWKRLGSGSYNQVYKSVDGLEVLKVQSRQSPTDTPERSVRLWNMLNSHIDPPARVVPIADNKRGWVCPYIEGKQSSDKEMNNALIDIFNRSGRIIVKWFN